MSNEKICDYPGCKLQVLGGSLNSPASSYCEGHINEVYPDKYRKMNAKNRMMTGTTSTSKNLKGGEDSEK